MTKDPGYWLGVSYTDLGILEELYTDSMGSSIKKT